VRAPDINHSLWDNTLERDEAGALALRLGFRQIDGFSEDWAKTLEAARKGGFASLPQLARRTALPRRALVKLADADAFRSLKLDRREALWAVRRLSDDTPLPLFPEEEEDETAPLPIMPLSEHVIADYQTIRLSLKGYPTQFLRAQLQKERILSCAEAVGLADGMRCRCAGIVLVRQMPGAKGVVFVTLSDETGIANVVIWPSVFERFRAAVMGARLLLVEGRIQRSAEGVVHIVSERLSDRSRDLARLLQDEPVCAPPKADHPIHRHPRNVRILPKSRDFH
jgi:error-prone DNA polymerase